MFKQRLENTQQLLKENNIDLYVLPMADFHQSEYLSEHFKGIAFLTGFTGSAGTLVVGHDEVCLWVDGRYFIQADNQSAIHGIKIMKMGLPDVPTVIEYLNNHEQASLGFDGRLLAPSFVEQLSHKTINPSFDALSTLWNDRPPLPNNPGFLYNLKYCGESRVDKFNKIKEQLNDAKYHIICTLDDIAWIFNIRGRDVACNPTMLAYAIISTKYINLYIQPGTLDSEQLNELENDGVTVKSYNDIYEDIKEIDDTVLLHKESINYAIFHNISKDIKIINDVNPSQALKAIKNEVEIKNTINAHIKDGVAMTKFMYHLKNELTSSDEVSLANYCKTLRSAQPDFFDISFETICGYQENGALMHYQATPKNHSKVEREGLLLVDSGGQYLDGTTDITRTFALGNITDEQRKDYTIVLKGMMRLSRAVFIKGMSGLQLDILARGIVYENGLDYRCGTGHGVGHFLGVHEGPNGFRPKSRPGGYEEAAILPGMITTNEPGIYKEGKHGIRIEDELLCVVKEENEYGQFLEFKTITYCPIDLDAVDFTMLNEDEIAQLHAYHQDVYTTVSPYLTEDEKSWLTNFIKA